MKPSAIARNRRILVIDDNSAIHDDFRKILGAPEAADAELDAFEANLFGGYESAHYEIDTALQGDEGLRKVERALMAGRPYAVAVVDVRMPPGWDGIETTRRIWEVDPDLQVVICTAFSDYSWEEMQEQTMPGDRMLILKKPFEAIEVKQVANTLTEKWRLAREAQLTLNNLDALVRQRTEQLAASEAAALRMMREADENRVRVQAAYEELTRETAERVRLQQQFKEQASLLDKARDAIIVRDLEHRVTYWNKGAERIYGWTADEAMGRSVCDLLYGDTAGFLPACQEVLEKGDWVGELRQIGRNGVGLTTEARWTLVRNGQALPQSILEIATDVTQQKKLEQQYLRAQRMESIGTLAGGIAHDLNNVLTPIIMSIDLLKGFSPDSRSLEVLDVIATSATRGADLVNQVLTFARGMEGRRVQVDVRALMGDIGKIISDTFPKNIKIHIAANQDVSGLTGDLTQLHQVFLNLCVNARDAMPNGGHLTLSAENVILDQAFAETHLDAKAGPYVLFQVIDTGAGIPDAIIESIFDPFFTTKELGKGTGLGLATSLGIVKSHGGFLHVSSQVGKGTRFQVYLPARAGDSERTVAAGSDEHAVILGKGEWVLVIDDEEPFRQIIRSTLENCGYRVLLAADGIEGVAVYAQHRGKIAVVLTDMMMPAMDGAGTLESLRLINPEVLCIAASGITTNENVALAAEMGAKMFLPKPFTAQSLLKALSDVLAIAPAGK